MFILVDLSKVLKAKRADLFVDNIYTYVVIP